MSNLIVKLSTVFAILIACTADLSAVSTPTVVWDAGNDGDALPNNITWVPSVGASNNLLLEVDMAGGVTHNAAPTTNHVGITGSYVFPGNGSPSRTNFGAELTLTTDVSPLPDPYVDVAGEGPTELPRRSFQHAPGNWSDEHVSFEVWVKPDSLTGGQQVILEDGGGTGLSLSLNNQNLTFAKLPGNGSISTDITGLEGDFIQIVGTYNKNGGNNDQMRLFVNGVATAGTFTTNNNGNDWSGGDGFALGTVGEANMGGFGGGDQGFKPLDGEVGLLRVYRNDPMTVEEVTTAYNQIAGLAGVDSSVDTAGTAVFRTLQAGDNLNQDQTYTSNSNMFLLLEHADLTLDQDIDLDHDGTSGFFNSNGSLSGTTLTAGTHVNSYILQHDDVANGSNTQSMTVTFDTEILGLGLLNSGSTFTLNDLDGALGKAGVIYSTNNGRLYGLSASENITISADRRTLTVNSVIGGGGQDQLRIFTAVIPEPATVTLGLLGICGLAARRRRRA